MKQKRLQLEQEQLIGTAKKVGASGADLIGKREEFQTEQVLRETRPETMEGTRKFSETLKCSGRSGG